MSLIERTLQNASNAPDHLKHRSRQNKQNELARKFLAQEINLGIFRKELLNLEEDEEGIVLPYPGPLYGLLRKIGLNKRRAKRIAIEEKAHFLVARECGLESRVIIEFTRESNTEPANLVPGLINVFLAYKIPNDVDEETMREAIRKISLAPDIPSKDDLAKLPNNVPHVAKKTSPYTPSFGFIN